MLGTPLNNQAQVGSWELGRHLGSGGMASVYLGWRRVGGARSGEVAAIKILHPNIAQSPELCQRFALEARLSAHMQHPNVVSFIDARVEGDRPYMAMAFIDGVSLSQLYRWRRARRQPLPGWELARLAVELLRGLRYAHMFRHPQTGAHLRLVHRDIKPGNLLLNMDGRLHIGDFGIASADNRGFATATGNLPGTLSFMAPELFQDNPPQPSPAHDLWAAGVALYEVAALRPLFRTGSHASTILRVQQVDTQREVDALTHTPPLFREVLKCLLSRTPEAREESLRRRLQKLEAWYSFEPGPRLEWGPLLEAIQNEEEKTVLNLRLSDGDSARGGRGSTHTSPMPVGWKQPQGTAERDPRRVDTGGQDGFQSATSIVSHRKDWKRREGETTPTRQAGASAVGWGKAVKRALPVARLSQDETPRGTGGVMPQIPKLTQALAAQVVLGMLALICTLAGVAILRGESSSLSGHTAPPASPPPALERSAPTSLPEERPPISRPIPMGSADSWGGRVVEAAPVPERAAVPSGSPPVPTAAQSVVRSSEGAIRAQALTGGTESEPSIQASSQDGAPALINPGPPGRKPRSPEDGGMEVGVLVEVQREPLSSKAADPTVSPSPQRAAAPPPSPVGIPSPGPLKEAQEATSERVGRLSFNTVPWSIVLLPDGARRSTPVMGLELPAGAHVITIYPQGDEARPQRVSLDIPEDGDRRATFDLDDEEWLLYR